MVTLKTKSFLIVIPKPRRNGKTLIRRGLFFMEKGLVAHDVFFTWFDPPIGNGGRIILLGLLKKTREIERARKRERLM